MSALTARNFPALLIVSLLCGASAADAAVRIEVGGPGTGVPAYARIASDRVLHDDTWAAIVFYRPPECVPGSFNLLSFLDPPRPPDNPGAFRCPLTISGHEIWKNAPPPVTPDLGPIQAESRGKGAVPIWFVKWDELQTAMQDGVLTVPELLGLRTLRIGTATFFQEVNHALDAAQRDFLGIVAHGQLADGTAFQFHVTASLTRPDLIVTVKISFS